MNILEVGDCKVHLIAGGGKSYAHVAGMFCKSELAIDDILKQPYKPEVVEKIINSGHDAALEFDHYIFGVEGISRVCETQLVRKRLASFLIKSNREDKHGKRKYEVAIPKTIKDLTYKSVCLDRFMSTTTLLLLLEEFYNEGVKAGLPEEDLRYLKPQATTTKALISMNAHALKDWFKIRCCFRAQFEIRYLAFKMLEICQQVSPDVFKNAGSNCQVLGYCPENELQCSQFSDIIHTKKEAFRLLGREYDD